MVTSLIRARAAAQAALVSLFCLTFVLGVANFFLHDKAGFPIAACWFLVLTVLMALMLGIVAYCDFIEDAKKQVALNEQHHRMASSNGV